MNIKTEPISEKIGQTILNINNISIFELDKEEIVDLFKSYKVLLFRGFETSSEIFKEFTDLFSTNFSSFAGGSIVREKVGGDETILKVTYFNDELKLHGELYYQKYVPLMLWFYCANPPLKDGETIVADGRQFFNELSNDTKELFSRKQIKYTRHIPNKEWQKIYLTEDLDLVRNKCEENNINLRINPDNSIVTEYICPAVIPSRHGNDKVYINSILTNLTKREQFQPNRICITFEDDSEIPGDVIAELREISDRINTLISWQRGDILMIDNTTILHGRKAFSDNQRDIYIRICNPNFPF